MITIRYAKLRRVNRVDVSALSPMGWVVLFIEELLLPILAPGLQGRGIWQIGRANMKFRASALLVGMELIMAGFATMTLRTSSVRAEDTTLQSS